MHTYSFRDHYRKFVNSLMMTILSILSILAVLPFLFIIYYVLDQGMSALNLNFFTQLPQPPGESRGGMSNALLGSLIVVGMACLFGLPWGLGLGVYLSEYKHTKTADILRFGTDLLMSAPSIVIGIFVYGVVVAQHGFSAYAGAMALMIILLPLLARGTEEVLKMIPNHIREAGLALGLPRWKVILRVLLPGAGAMLVTVVILAIARIAGETAPLLFTSFGNQYHIASLNPPITKELSFTFLKESILYYMTSLNQPIATLPVEIYELSKSGFATMEQQAWTGAMILVLFVFLINFFVRIFFYFFSQRAKTYQNTSSITKSIT